MLFFRWRLVLGASVLMSCGGSDGGTVPTGDQTLESITISPSGTTSLAAGTTLGISVTAYDASNQVIQSPGTATFTSANAAIAEVDARGEVLGLLAGATQVTVSLTRGGVTKTATLTVQVTGSLPLSTTVQATAGFDDGYGNNSGFLFTPRKVAIAQNGTVNWTFGSVEHTVTFSGAGAQYSIQSGMAVTIGRTFATAGTFTYVCGIHPGMSGTVIVR